MLLYSGEIRYDAPPEERIELERMIREAPFDVVVQDRAIGIVTSDPRGILITIAGSSITDFAFRGVRVEPEQVGRAYVVEHNGLTFMIVEACVDGDRPWTRDLSYIN